MFLHYFSVLFSVLADSESAPTVFCGFREIKKIQDGSCVVKMTSFSSDMTSKKALQSFIFIALMVLKLPQACEVNKVQANQP